MNILQLLSNMICFILHITDAKNFPKQLTKKEEAEAIEMLKNGNPEGKRILIEHNLRLVAHIVKKYYSNVSEQDDLISIGTVGLIKGINSYNPEKGVKLATYCARCVDNEILMHFRSIKKLSQETSFSDPIDTDSEGNPLTLMDIIAVDDTIVDDIDTKEKLCRLVEILKQMPSSREKSIIIKRYGLSGDTPLTQQEIAEELKISRSYVSRIEKKVLNDMKKLF